MEQKEDTRKRILEEAERLFTHYGFAKTTMVEVAEKCGMSAANIYRFFRNKEEIIAEMAARYFREVEDGQREVVKRAGLTARERLETFVSELLRQSYKLCCCNEKMNEAIGFVICRRADLMARHRDVIQSLLAEILAEGNRSGEFEVHDVVEAAGIVLDATASYQSSGCAGATSLEDLETSAGRMMSLLVSGLGKG